MKCPYNTTGCNQITRLCNPCAIALKKESKMKVSMVVRKRVKTDGISGISPSVELLCDLKIGSADRGQIQLIVPVAEYDEFEPGSMWEAELVKL